MTKNPKETTREIEDMGIHEKLMNIKLELLECDIKKSGHNEYGNFDYHELKDLLPPITRLCHKYRCLTHFTFPNEKDAFLILINVDDVDDTICTQAIRPQLRELPRMNIMQSEGSYETYMRRYLVLNMFDIVEPDTIDVSFENGNNTATQKKPKNNNAKKNKSSKAKVKPACFQRVLEECHETHPDEECDAKLVNSVSMAMMKAKKITRKEREEIYKYLFD